LFTVAEIALVLKRSPLSFQAQFHVTIWLHLLHMDPMYSTFYTAVRCSRHQNLLQSTDLILETLLYFIFILTD